MNSDDSPDSGQSLQPSATAPAAPPVDLADDGGSGNRRSRLQVGVVIGVVMALVVGVGALVLTRKGEPSPAEVLAEVRAFVKQERTATFTGVSEWSYAPKSGDLGHSSTNRSRLTGELRLPSDVHVVLDGGDFVQEQLVQGPVRYMRSGESRAELEAEEWVKWPGVGAATEGMPPVEVMSSLAGPPGAALTTASGVMSAFGSGMPIELDALFDKLEEPERVAPNRIRATVELRDLVPEEVKQEIEEAKAKAAAAAATSTTTTPGEGDEEEEDFAFEDEEVDWSVDEGTLTVTIEYGPDGRLDVLAFDVERDEEDDRTKEHEEYRFANWGKPVTLAPPPAEQVDQTPTIDEKGLAEFQKKFTVLAPTTLPAGWKLQALEVEESDDDSETCASVDLTFAADLTEASFSGEDEPPSISVTSVEPGCEWLEDNLPDMSDARTVRIGPWTAKVSNDTEDNHFTYLESGLTFAFQVNKTQVVAAGNLPEAQVISVLRTLGPIDLSKQPIGTGGPHGF